MRILKLAAATAAASALAAFAVATTASAEITLWKYLGLPVGTHFSGRTGKATLQIKGSGTITCKESKLTEKESEITEPEANPTLALAIITFTGCKAFGLADESLGAASGTIVAHLHMHNCALENGGPGEIVEPLPIHIEIPSTGLLITIEGRFVLELTPVGAQPTKIWDPVIEQKEGVPAITKCQGGEALTLSTSVDGSEFTPSAEEAKEPMFEYPKAWEATA